MVAPKFLSSFSSSYELQSVVEHVGDSAKSGHYHAYGRDVASGQWFRYDDATGTLSSHVEATRRPYVAQYQRLHTTLSQRRRILSFLYRKRRRPRGAGGAVCRAKPSIHWRRGALLRWVSSW